MKTLHPRRRPTPTLFLKATIVLGAIVAAVALAAQARSLAIDDLRLEVRLSSLALSPDARTAVVVTHRPNYEAIGATARSSSSISPPVCREM
jgi:hypothetical protein